MLKWRLGTFFPHIEFMAGRENKRGASGETWAFILKTEKVYVTIKIFSCLQSLPSLFLLCVLLFGRKPTQIQDSFEYWLFVSVHFSCFHFVFLSQKNPSTIHKISKLLWWLDERLHRLVQKCFSRASMCEHQPLAAWGRHKRCERLPSWWP